MKRFLGIAFSAFLAGCADLREYTDGQLIGSRNQYLAWSSWKANAGQISVGKRHHRELRRGYLDGYLAVATGQQGCPPILPPQEFWGACYQDNCGHERINQWFAGYNEGSAAAMRDGVSTISEVSSWCQPECGQNGPMFGAPPKAVASGIRKPRRGDPPVRRTLPPEIDAPKSSTEKSPLDPSTEPDPDVEPPKVGMEEDVPPPPKASGVKSDEPIDAKIDLSTEPGNDRKSKQSDDRPPGEKSDGSALLPLNPFAPTPPKKPTASSKRFPANPPMIPSQGLRSAKSVDLATPKASRMIDEGFDEPTMIQPSNPPTTTTKTESKTGVKREAGSKGQGKRTVAPVGSQTRKITEEDDGGWDTPHDRPASGSTTANRRVSHRDGE